MAMNGNEGGSAYPPNPDVKSDSCLIAGFHALTDIRPSYWNAYFNVLRDAQRAADAWNRDHAAPQRTYRGRAR